LNKEEINMKKYDFIAIIVLTLLFVNSFTAEAVRPDITVSGYSIKNGTASVGKDFILSLTLTNIYPGACANSIVTTLQANYPFIMRGVSSVSAGDICNTATAIADIPLRIDPTAKGGFYQIAVTNSYESITLAQFTSTDTINIFVEGEPDIDANIINSDPVDVYPGDTATITVNIENKGTFLAQSVNAVMTAQSPLSVKWSKSFSPVGNLDAKQSRQVDFAVEIPKDAAAKDYPLSLEVKYEDENVIEKSKQFIFSFHVKKKAMFSVLDGGSDSLFSNENSRTVRLILNNTGTDTARNIKVRMIPMFPFSTDGSVRYIDILEPGKTTPVQFTVNIDKDATPGTYGLDMLLDFEDEQGKSLQDTTRVALTVKPKNIIRAVFIDYWYLWVIVVIVIIVIRTRRMSSEKKKKK
jgi:hypothetical protein